MLTGVQAFESSLTTLEQVLTTPLPFVVWLYLFLLPLQLVSDFVWHTIPAVSVGAFVYLGFVAAGEEIEQPFGYDDNDLDLDMFTRDIIRPDIQRLKRAPCLNAWFPPAPTPTPPPASTSAPTASPDAGAPANFSPGANGDAGSRGAGAASLGLGTGGYANLGTGGYAYGSNIYRASLASLSDVASIVEGDDEYEVEVEVEVDAETGAEEAAVEEDAEDLGDVDADGEARDVREAELVDVR
ncbi:Bestrophin, RFP-TM, chloride channel-domain-containing protein [Mycena latifolia]|nr:Bestrophin, RFP-TM, chloride channel-domain-containing protein [Mycena latifolia]